MEEAAMPNVAVVNSSYQGRYISRFPSVVDGPGMPVSIDVCKIPAPPAPFVPVPYPTMSWGTADANKQAVSQGLKSKLQTLHTQIGFMCEGKSVTRMSSDDSTSLHKLLDEYADTVGKLHYMKWSTDVKVGAESQQVRRFP
jgi:hypothetical protein